MSEDSGLNKDQKKEEERSIALDFSGSMGKGMMAKEKIETLKKSSGLTPLSFGVNVHNKNIDRENIEEKRAFTNPDTLSSLLNFSDHYAENTDLLSNSTGLTTLHPFDEIYGKRKKNVSLIEGFLDNEGMETLKSSSGLTPLNYDSEPPMDTGKRINSPQRTLRMQRSGLTNLVFKGE